MLFFLGDGLIRPITWEMPSSVFKRESLAFFISSTSCSIVRVAFSSVDIRKTPKFLGILSMSQCAAMDLKDNSAIFLSEVQALATETNRSSSVGSEDKKDSFAIEDGGKSRKMSEAVYSIPCSRVMVS